MYDQRNYRRVSCFLVLGLSAVSCLRAPVGTDDKDPLKRGLTIDTYAESDLLLVIDNSASMADKQRVLAESLKQVLGTIRCTDERGLTIDAKDAPAGSNCIVVGDGVRIGVVTTDLGTGNEGCEPANSPGHLVPRPGGKLFFDGSDDDIGEFLESELEDWILGLGESGCGYEAPLESAYRFLIDPSPLWYPPADAQTTSEPTLDTQLLDERRSFVRPGSALVVVFLTDEDDCSLDWSKAGRMMSEAAAMLRATSECDADPADRCCRSCSEPDAGAEPDECPPVGEDENCALGLLSELENPADTRCFDQKRRFGIELTHSTARYVRGFTSDTVEGPDGSAVPNPLFESGKMPEQVHVAAIVGVPWQLLEGVAAGSAPFDVPSADELLAANAWPRLVGPDVDKHLIPSIEPRQGLAAPSSQPWADPMNSHEFDNPYRATLQLSCAFPLEQPKDCETEGCDCASFGWPDGTVAPLSPNNPLCQSASGSYDSTQRAAGAVPPPRLLEVIKEVGGIVGPICPASAADGTSIADGFLGTFFELLPWFGFGVPEGVCLPVPIPHLQDAVNKCRLIERLPAVDVDCERPARRVAGTADAQGLLPPKAKLADFTFCEILPVPGDYEPDSPFYSCANDANVDPDLAGYCIIDPQNGVGSDRLVAFCPEDAKRRIRVVPSTSNLNAEALASQSLFYVCD